MVIGISLEDALTRMTLPLSPLGAERLPLEAALGRTLAVDVTSPLDQPPFDRSPLDGYALRSADLTGADKQHPAVLEVVDTVYAGDERAFQPIRRAQPDQDAAQPFPTPRKQR